MSATSVNKDVPIKPSRYDSIVSALIALIALKAVAVSCLFLIWLFQESPNSVVSPDQTKPSRRVVVEDSSDSEVEPGAKEFPEVEPTLKLENEMEALQDQVSTILASENFSGGKGDGIEGPGIGRDPGPGIDPDEIVPAFKRWRVGFEVTDREQYKKLLDHFEIQIGMGSPKSPKVWRVTNVSTTPQVNETTRKNLNEDMNRQWLMFVNSSQRIRDWDADFAKEAGVPVAKDFLRFQVYPPVLRKHIAQIEAEFLAAANRKIEDVRKTHLRIVADGVGFTFSVDRCEYR